MSPNSSRTKGGFEDVSPTEVALMLESRFGIPEDVFAGHSFYRKAQSIWVSSNSVLPELSYETIGLRMISLKDRPWKPTTRALQIFGRYATKNTVCLTSSQMKIFMAGESQAIHPDSQLDPGYVVVMYNGNALGCGLYSRGLYSHGIDSNRTYPHGKLISQIPKESRIIFEEGVDI